MCRGHSLFPLSVTSAGATGNSELALLVLCVFKSSSRYLGSQASQGGGMRGPRAICRSQVGSLASPRIHRMPPPADSCPLAATFPALPRNLQVPEKPSPSPRDPQELREPHGQTLLRSPMKASKWNSSMKAAARVSHGAGATRGGGRARAA